MLKLRMLLSGKVCRRLINASEAREDDEDFKNPVDLMFDRLEEKDPEHFAVKQYKKYKLAAGDLCSKRLVYPIFR